MAQIGCFGDIAFETSDRRVLTPSNLKQKVSARWGKHNLIARKPRAEFEGPELRQITFTITLNALYGTKPREILEKIETMIENGYVGYMVIGNKAMGYYQYAITEMSETWDIVYSGGELAKATLNITLQEYV